MSIYAWTDSQGPSEAVAHAVRGLGKGRWGVEGRMPFQYLNALKSRMRMTPEDAEPILQGLRAVKDQDEVRLMKKSGEILSRSFDEAPNLIDLGMTELELARKLADLIIAKGASGVSDLLVQSGPRAANPHGLASKKRIKSGEPIILDLVSVYEGYYADITRTLCIGRSVEVERVYEQVLEAQSRARAAAGEGVAVGSVDRAARKYLVDHGLGKYFIHRTGHGLGLEVHEEPYIVDGGDALLRENMFFTIEPGVYIPGKIGVRIEDDVRVDGHRALETTNPPKQYGWWK
jgi:Xaa-Pro aminopeptidase